VGNVERLTPRFVRVLVEGGLDDWPEPGPAAHVKIFLPQPVGDPVMRTYTVRSFDRKRGGVAVDVFLHDGDGPAVRWAAAARPGDELQLSGRSRSMFEPSERRTSYVFAGDASALPAIATCVEALPASARALVAVALGDRLDRLPLESEAKLDVRWLDSRDEDAFVEAVASADAERAWVACEALLMRRVRARLLEDGRYARGVVSTRGYWKRGAANHPDHDTGEDDA
jgi:NADPH-dependent ferric siderophore reductase